MRRGGGGGGGGVGEGGRPGTRTVHVLHSLYMYSKSIQTVYLDQT